MGTFSDNASIGSRGAFLVFDAFIDDLRASTLSTTSAASEIL